MKKIVSVLVFCLLSNPFVLMAEEENEDGLIKGGIKALVSGTVATGKDVITGVSEGVDEGRKAGQSTDGAIVVTSKDDFQKYVNISVVKMEDLGEQSFRVTMAARNDGEQPIRLSSLSEAKNVMLLDKDGFYYTLSNPVEQGADITIQPRSASRLRFTFDKVEEMPVLIRFFDVDFNVPGDS